MSEITENELEAAEQAVKTEEEIEAQKALDAEELRKTIKSAEKEGGEYVRMIVRHANPYSSGSIYVAAVRSFYIKPDVEVVVPEWIVGRLKESTYPTFNKNAEGQINKPMYSVEILERGLTQYHYKNFLKEHSAKISK